MIYSSYTLPGTASPVLSNVREAGSFFRRHRGRKCKLAVIGAGRQGIEGMTQCEGVRRSGSGKWGDRDGCGRRKRIPKMSATVGI